MRWQSDKINELTKLVETGKRVKEISVIMGISESSIHNKIHRLGLVPIFKEIIVCKECGVEFTKYIKQKQVFCSSSCSASHNNKLKILSNETKNKISEGLKIWNKENPKIKDNYKSKKIKKCRFCGKDNPVRQKIICEDCKNKYYNFYRPSCEFSFNINIFKNEFDLSLISEYGWYSPTNKRNNLDGISKDHMYSVKDGFINNISSDIIRHPANCKLMIHSENNLKNSNSSITIDDLLLRINEWNSKYPSLIGLF